MVFFSHRRVTEEYMSDSFWNIEVFETKKPKNQFLIRDNEDLITPEKIRSNIIQKCLLLEGISRFSELITTDFGVVLLTILCPFLEEVGSPAMQISHTATLGLKVIAENCMKRCVSCIDIIREDEIEKKLVL